jgi:polyisoprenoid-binding protein YceI
MKNKGDKFLLSLGFFTAALFLSFVPHGTIHYRADVKNSTVGWHARKVTGEHMGNIKIKTGTITVDHHVPTRGEFVIDMNSITCSDIKDATYNAKLVNHLKSEDFFDVTKYPEAVFKIKSFTPLRNTKKDEPNYTVRGDLTIKGITKEISFPATMNISDKEITARAEIKIDRTEFDVRYGSGKFFENLGDKMIYDDFTIQVNLKALPR